MSQCVCRGKFATAGGEAVPENMHRSSRNDCDSIFFFHPERRYRRANTAPPGTRQTSARVGSCPQSAVNTLVAPPRGGPPHCAAAYRRGSPLLNPSLWCELPSCLRLSLYGIVIEYAMDDKRNYASPVMNCQNTVKSYYNYPSHTTGRITDD